MSWAGARAHCQDLGTDLAEMNTRGEQAALARYLNNYREYQALPGAVKSLTSSQTMGSRSGLAGGWTSEASGAGCGLRPGSPSEPPSGGGHKVGSSHYISVFLFLWTYFYVQLNIFHACPGYPRAGESGLACLVSRGRGEVGGARTWEDGHCEDKRCT